MFGQRKIDDLSVEELQKALLMKRRRTRMERFQELSEAGRSANEALVGLEAKQGKEVSSIWVPLSNPKRDTPVLAPDRAKKLRITPAGI